MNDVPIQPLGYYLRAALAETTRRAYRPDLLRFLTWGGRVPASSEQIATYFASHATTHRPATLERWRVSIGNASTTRDLPDPNSRPNSVRAFFGHRSGTVRHSPALLQRSPQQSVN